MKKLIMLSVALLLSFMPMSAFAHGTEFSYGYYGTTSTNDVFMQADGTANDDFWIDLSVGGSSGQIIWFNYGTEISRTNTPVSGASAPSNANSFKLTSLDGGEVYATVGHTTNPASEHVIFTGSNGTGGGGSTDPTPVPEGADCALCECKQELLDAMAAINGSVTSNGETLSDVLTGVNNLNTKVTQSNNLLDGILGELQTSLNPSMPSMTTPPSLSENKPDMPTTAFEDTDNYFSDKGDTTAQPEPLPTAPEPENWKNEDGSIVNPDDELTKGDENSKDAENSRDDVLNQDDPLSPDLELQPDAKPVRDAPVMKDSELTRNPENIQDSVSEIEPVLGRDSEFNQTEQNQREPVSTRDGEFTKSPELNQNHFYDQTPVDNTAPTWRSN